MILKLSTARITGLLYIGLAITGMLAFLYVSQGIYVESGAAATSANLVESEGLARFGIAAEIALVGFQALTAVWFFKLFRKKDSFAAGLVAIFGMVNAVGILMASAMWYGALNAALANQVEQAQLLYDLHENIWLVLALFFGLWLIPMAYLAKISKFPAGIALFLLLGGIGYILSAFIAVLIPDSSLVDVIAMPATIGEFWMIGYLLIKNPVIK